MSWLFGLRKDPNSELNASPRTETASGSGDGNQQPQQSGGNNPNSRPSEAYRFDSSALERAAQAAKDLEKSSKILCINCYLINFYYFISGFQILFRILKRSIGIDQGPRTFKTARTIVKNKGI